MIEKPNIKKRSISLTWRIWMLLETFHRSLPKRNEAVLFVALEMSWERAHSLLGPSSLMIVPYNSCLAGNELISRLTKNPASDVYVLSSKNIDVVNLKLTNICSPMYLAKYSGFTFTSKLFGRIFRFHPQPFRSKS